MYIDKGLTEKELLNDLIYSEKYISSSYNNVITESSCPQLRDILSRCQLTSQSVQYSIHDALDKRGWNRIKLVTEKEIKDIIDKYRQKTS